MDPPTANSVDCHQQWSTDFTSLLKDCCISGKMLDMSNGGPALVPPPPPGPGPGPLPPPGPGPDVPADTEPGTASSEVNNHLRVAGPQAHARGNTS